MESILKDCEFYGFSGKIGSGKDYLAGVLSQMLPQKNTLFVALADMLKINSIIKYNLDRNKVFGSKDEATRKALQLEGSEFGRDKYGEDIWIKYLQEWMIVHANRGIRRFFITDIRFTNEMNFFLDIGHVFRVNSPQRTSDRIDKELLLQGIPVGHPEFESRKKQIAGHVSETALDNFTTDSDNFILFDNDPGQDSIEKLRKFTMDLYPPILKRNNITTGKLPEYTYFVDLDDTICECYKYYNMVQKSVAIYLNVSDEDFASHDKVVNPHWEIEPFYRDSFAVGLVDTALHIDPNLSKNQLEIIYELGMEVHNLAFEEIPGAVEAVKKLKASSRCQLVIFTIGNRADQLRKICKLGLHTVVDSIEVADMKEVSLFRMLKLKYPAKRYCMFGDSLKRDIQPAQAAGIDHTFHVTKENPLSKIVSDLFDDTQ